MYFEYAVLAQLEIFMDFSRVPAAIRALSLENARRIGGPMPRGWRVEFPPPDHKFTLGDLIAPEWTADLVLYAAELRGIAGQIIATLNQVGWSPENVAAGYTLYLAAVEEANTYHNLALDRPGVDATAFLHWQMQTASLAKFAADNRIGTPLQVVRGRMRIVGEELTAVFELFFGRKSVGWLSPDEKTKFISMLKSMVNGVGEAGIKALWEKHGGKEQEWPQAWKRFAEKVAQAIEKFESKPAPDESLPLGEAAVASYFAERWIENSPYNCLQIAKQRETALLQEISRIKRLIDEQHVEDPAVIPSSDEHLRELLEDFRKRFKAELVDTGILPAAWDPTEVTIQVLPPGDKGAIMAGATIDGRRMVCMPFTGNEALWRSYLYQRLGHTVVHELVHCGQAKQQVVPSNWVGRLAMEASATHVQWVWTLLQKNMHVTLAGLQADYNMARQMRVILELHLGIETRESVIIADFVRDTGRSEEAGKTMLQGARVGPSFIGMYWLGGLFTEQYIWEHYFDNVAGAFKHLATTTGLVVPAHLLLGIMRGPRFWLLPPQVPIAVQVSQKLHPLTKK